MDHSSCLAAIGEIAHDILGYANAIVVNTYEGKLRLQPDQLGTGLSWPSALQATHMALEVEPGEHQEEHVQNAAKVLGHAIRGVRHVEKRFGIDIPDWAIAIHPVMRAALRLSSYSPKEMLLLMKDPYKLPEEREEYHLRNNSGFHLDLRHIRLKGLSFRASRTIAMTDLADVPQSLARTMQGRSFDEIIDIGDIGSATGRPIIYAGPQPQTGTGLRIQVHSPLEPLASPPEGENPWWIEKWSALLDAQLGRDTSYGVEK